MPPCFNSLCGIGALAGTSAYLSSYAPFFVECRKRRFFSRLCRRCFKNLFAFRRSAADYCLDPRNRFPIRQTAASSRFAFRFGRRRYADFGNAVACRIPRTGSEQKTVKISAAPARVCAARRDNRKTRKYG